MNTKRLAAALATTTILSSAAHAATITETYNFIGLGSDASYSSFDVIGDQGNIVTITAGNYSGAPNIVTTGANDRVARGDTWGLGAYSNGNVSGDHRVDGYYNEALSFSFDYIASVTSVTFGSFTGYFDVYGASSGSELDVSLATTVDLTSYGVMGDVVNLGAYYNSSSFKVREMTVSYEVPAVPLPAAGWMLFAGLGGLAAMKRRRKAA